MEQNFHWIQWIQQIQGMWEIIEASIGTNLKILPSQMCLAGLVVSYTWGGKFESF